jgi:hypothetical protein
VIFLFSFLDNLLTLCQRHPANIPALITEMEWKLEQDNYLITAIKDRLFEHVLEKQAYFDTFKHMKNLIKTGTITHNKLLEYRYNTKKSLVNQGIDDEKKLLAIQNDMRMPLKLKRYHQIIVCVCISAITYVHMNIHM